MFLLMRNLIFLYSLLMTTAVILADQQLNQQFPSETGSDQQEQIDQYVDKVNSLAEELTALQRPVPPELNLEDDGLAYYLDAAYSAQYNTTQDKKRFLVGRLVIINQSDRPCKINPREIKLISDGQRYAWKKVNDQGGYASLQWKHRHYNISELQVKETIEAPPGQVASGWIVFHHMDATADVPEMTLTWTSQGKRTEQVDLSLAARAEIQWRLQTIGPHGLIGVGKISGVVTPIGLGILQDELTLLSTNDVKRIIVQFDPEDPQIDPHILQWFVTAVSMVGQQNRNQQHWEFPPISPLIRELHLAEIPKGQGYHYSYNSRSANRIHEKLSEAILAASHSIYSSVSVPMLIQEIRDGHLYSRCAALIFGAPRLPTHFWRELVEILETAESQELKQAVVTALAEFPHPEAISILEHSATNKDQDLSSTALRSLAGSRFPEHHAALLKVYEQHPPLQETAIQMMASYPRPLWSDSLYQAAHKVDSKVRLEALRGLYRLNHPEVQPLLISLLEGDDKNSRQLAFQILMEQDTAQTRELAIQYALQLLKEEGPAEDLLQVITRYRVQEAVPLLVTQLDDETPLRSRIIQALATTGDQRVIDPFLKLYPQLNSGEKQTVLRTVAEIDQQQFYDFVPEVLKIKDEHRDQNLSQVLNIMQGMANEESIAVLIQMYDQLPEDSSQASRLIRAIGGYHSVESRQFLMKIRDSKNEQLKQVATSTLDAMWNRSPLNHLYRTGMSSLQQGKVELAIQQLTFVLEFDADYPRALEGRALAYQNDEQYLLALTDLEKLIQVDAKWPSAQGKMGQILTQLYRFEEAIPYLDRAIDQQGDNAQWYASRGHTYAMLERFEKSEQDYRQALKLDSNLMTAITGVALSLAIKGEIEQAIKQLEQGQEQFKENSVFAYNSACTYARAVQYLQTHDDVTPDQQQAIEKLKKSALNELQRSSELGFTDAEWTEKDPDLQALKGEAEFQDVLKTMRSKSTDDQPSTEE